MCGIFFSCSNSRDENGCCDDNLKEFLLRRGPDCFHEIGLVKFGYWFKFQGNVLHLRGDQLVKQPIMVNQNVLLWNGEMFNCNGENGDQSDSQFLFNQLELCDGDDQLIYRIIGRIQGPFAIIYWDEKSRTLFFGRDSVGRRSLCWKKADEPFELKLSSICVPGENDWEEIPANGIYSLNFSHEKPEVKLRNWKQNIAGELVDHIESIPSPIITTLNDELPNELNLISSVVDDETVNNLISILSQSIETRVTKFNQLCQKCVENFREKCDHSSVGILFSGGLDCTTLAILSDKYIPMYQSIDLINVAFSIDAPDRLTGLESFEEISALRPERRWNFVQIDVTLEDLKIARQKYIKHLIKPCNSVLDDSIACAVWFAAKGHGICRSVEYQSPARILLLGMGADEQFAGYSRHRTAFQRKGWQGLIDEVRSDIVRIPLRNLGRDDRIISDHGKECRLPYLDENLINYLNSLPIWKKTNLTLERGKGDKILLRFVALKLGLTKVSGFPKRAIQFGSRIAHLEKRKEKGHELCPRLTDLPNES
ncbi:asparagine synthetase domain-containing protein 1-like [Panonychus citri]|uniref:asparagine synthetase domain-containing protein 1-like n=1 Tax=Panonychus citri TaxID=50023 RepID=UPI002306FCDD|nr:asparagine synthetase domain-containing protein 1-like [Panonychus citri]